MPTQFSRCPWMLLGLMATSLAAHAQAQSQDLHIKKSITVGGNFISSTDTSIKGSRERTVSQSPTGTTVTLRQCDLKRTVTINDQAQTYYISNDPKDEAALKAAAIASGSPEATSGGYLTETTTVTDTGERKQMYGFPARHLKAHVTLQSSENACSKINQTYDLDGWYTDISKEQTSICGQFLPPIRLSEGCNDAVVRKRSGSSKPGYPLNQTMVLHNPDGTKTEVGTLVSELSKQNLDKELFEIPAGYHEAKSLSELNGGPKPQMPQTATTTFAPQMQQVQAPQQNIQQNTPNVAQMMNPMTAPAANQNALALMQGQMQMAQGMAGMPNMLGGHPTGGAGVASPPALGPKAPGKIRIGVAPPDAQVGQGSNNGGDYSTPIRNAEIALMNGPAIEIAALEAHIPIQLQAEAQQKQCDYILFSSVAVKHNQGGFGKFAKLGGMAASMSPMAAMTGGMRGAVAAQAAGMAASQMAQQQAMNQLAGFNGQIKSKDNVSVEYQLVAMGQTTPYVQNTLQGKAKSDGEDVLTPLLTQAATEVLTKVSQK
jgi:hypothetical protein